MDQRTKVSYIESKRTISKKNKSPYVANRVDITTNAAQLPPSSSLPSTEIISQSFVSNTISDRIK